jgi:hypothetical protein
LRKRLDGREERGCVYFRMYIMGVGGRRLFSKFETMGDYRIWNSRLVEYLGIPVVMSSRRQIAQSHPARRRLSSQPRKDTQADPTWTEDTSPVCPLLSPSSIHRHLAPSNQKCPKQTFSPLRSRSMTRSVFLPSTHTHARTQGQQ